MLVSKLQPIIARYDEISTLLQTPEILHDIQKLKTLSKEQSDIESLVQKARQYIQILDDIEQNKQLLEDKELGELAKEELKSLETQSKEIEEEIKILLIPKDPNDDKNIYLELRAGTGGDEAGIFVGDLFKAYCRYADLQKWKVEIKNSFIRVNGRRISNGPIESTNSKIKTIIKTANGIRSFYRFRNRVLYSINKDRLFKIS